jgi:hypothetical protein
VETHHEAQQGWELPWPAWTDQGAGRYLLLTRVVHRTSASRLYRRQVAALSEQDRVGGTPLDTQTQELASRRLR